MWAAYRRTHWEHKRTLTEGNGTAMTVLQSAGRRPPGAARLGHHPALALTVIAASQLMVVLDATIVNIALPQMQQALGFSTSDLSWVLNAYTLTFGGLLLLGGRPGRRYPRPPPGVRVGDPALHPGLVPGRVRDLAAGGPGPAGGRRRRGRPDRSVADHHQLRRRT